MSKMLEALREHDPMVIVSTQNMAMQGYTLAAIANQTGLGINIINDILAQVVPFETADKLLQSEAGREIGIDPSQLTYGHVRTISQARRDNRIVRVADATTNLRTELLRRADQMVRGGHVASFRDIISALRVVGVPTAGAMQDSPALEATNRTAPSRFILDEAGKYTENPAYQAYIAKKDVVNQNAVILQVSPDVLKMAGTAGANGKLHTDAEGNVVGMVVENTDGEPEVSSLQSMSSQVLHQIAYGAGSDAHAKKRPDCHILDDLI